MSLPSDSIIPASTPKAKASNQEKGIQEVILEKDEKGKLGLKVRNIKNGVYIMEIVSNSPAAKAGLMPGDRILQINGTKVDKYDDEKMHDLFKKLPTRDIKAVINKRPLEKIVVIKKDQKGHLGFNLRSTKIHSVAKCSPAEIEGLSTDHYIVEVNGTKVRGMREEEIRELLKSNDTVTVTVMPYYLYEPLMKQ